MKLKSTVIALSTSSQFLTGFSRTVALSVETNNFLRSGVSEKATEKSPELNQPTLLQSDNAGEIQPLWKAH